METHVTTTQVLYPALRYDDAHGAIAWLCEAFGFERRVVYDAPDGGVAHRRTRVRRQPRDAREARARVVPYPAKTPRALGGVTGSIYVYVADPDAHCARARGGGRDDRDRAARHGIRLAREYATRDCAGYWWSFGTYRP